MADVDCLMPRPFTDEDLAMFAYVLTGLRYVFPYADLETYKTEHGDWVVNFLACKDGDILLSATRRTGATWVWLKLQQPRQQMLIRFVSLISKILSFR
jgi:hypothetical protein